MNDIIEAIPVHLRDDLYFALEQWYTSAEREEYAEQNKQQHEKTLIRHARMRILNKTTFEQ